MNSTVRYIHTEYSAVQDTVLVYHTRTGHLSSATAHSLGIVEAREKKHVPKDDQSYSTGPKRLSTRQT